MCGGGGAKDTYSEVNQTTSNLPEWARPYLEDMLSRAGAETSKPYESYTGDRLAYFSPAEQEAMSRGIQLGVSGTPEELNQAGQMAYSAGQPFDSNNDMTDFSQGYGANSRRSNFQAGSLGGDAYYDPNSRESQYVAGQMGDGANYNAGSRQVGFDPGSLADAEMLAKYSSPYMQNVVDIQKREAGRDADIRNKNIGLDSAGTGSLGGYREAIMRSNNERDVMQQMGDIQAQGLQASFSDAKQSFEADRAARAQLEQFGQSQFGMNEQFRQRQAELVQQGFSAQEASRIAQEQLSQSQFGMNEQARQKAAELVQQGFSLEEASRIAQEQMTQSQWGMNMQDRQFGADVGLRSADLRLQSQLGKDQMMLAQQQNQLAGAGMLGDFAAQRQGMELERLGLLSSIGEGERRMLQSGLDTGYQDWMRQQAYGGEQLNLYSSLLNGLPITPGSTSSIYGPRPSTAEQFIGNGIVGVGAYNAFNKTSTTK